MSKKDNETTIDNKSINDSKSVNDKKTVKDKKEKNKKEKKDKFCLKDIRNGIVDFSKLLWACITYKLILLIIAAIYIAYAFSGFKAGVQRQINKNTKTYLSSMVSESLERIRLKINDEYNVLTTLGMLYDGNDEIDMEMTEDMFTKAMGNHEFVGLELISSEKNELVSLGEQVKYQDEFLTNVMNGNNSVSTIVADTNEGVEYICLGVPVYKNQIVVGALVCSYEINEFTEILDTSSFEKLGTTFISQEDGILVARPENVGENTNLFKLLDSININNEKSIMKLKKSIKNGRSGIITYGNGKHKRYLCYDVVPDTNWYAVSIVSASTIEPVAKKVSSKAVSFATTLSFVFAVYIIITMTMDIRMAKRKQKQ